MRRIAIPSRPRVEALEDRILHSADLAPLLVAAQAPAQVQAPLLAPATTTDAQAHEIAFVDAALPDAASLIADLQAQQSAGRPIEIVTIGSGVDGVASITAALAASHDISAVHVLAHGSDGLLQLGSSVLDEQTLMQHAGEVASWSQALAPGADLMLYGCDVAQTASGQRFVKDLAALTGAAVAASTDLTGAAALGGDWTLEYSTGRIDAALAPSAVEQSQWNGVMATFTADPTKADGAVGSLRWAISQANATPGADTIVVPAGTYTLTILGAGENMNLTGDLDVRDNTTIVGAGAASTVISGGNRTAVLQIVMGTTSLSGVTIAGGSTVAGGAGIEVSAGATLNLSQSIVRNNASTAASGGGILNGGALSLTDVEVRDNSAALNGGGIDNEGTSLTLDRVTLAGNTAWNGAGMYSAGAATSLSNVTVSDNAAGHQGGGLFLTTNATLVNATIAYNSAGASGGGIKTSVALPGVTLRNVILADNTNFNLNHDDNSSGVTSLGNNLSSANDAELSQASDIKSTDPLLGPLQDNGGYTRTRALPTGSAAINAGTAIGAPLVDQRGYPRAGTPDIGAYEAIALVVDTASDVVNGNTSSVAALLANKGLDGKISLREALIAANNTPGTDEIDFAIGAGGLQTIHLASALPTVTDAVVIDATTQPGWAGAPLIQLDGSAAGGDGLTITAGGTTVRGLIINGFSGVGISLLAAGNDVVQGNYIGTNAASTAAAANLGGGIYVESSNNQIGGTTAAQRNVISGNGIGDLPGISLWGSGATGNLIQGNYIGVNAAGTAAVPNTGDGIDIDGGAGNTTIGGTAAGAGNVISGNNSPNNDGIWIHQGSGNTIQGNRIGTDAAGTVAIGNGWSGVYISGSTDNSVGGTAPGAGNVIANAGTSGVVVIGNTSLRNAILGNSVYGNAALGIDLKEDGVSVNDGTKSASSPNAGMDSPVFTTATIGGTTLTLAGHVGSAAGQAAFANARVEVFVSDGNAGSYGEGRTYLGALSADASGNFSGTLTVGGVAAGSVITGTATDGSNDSSEFGANVAVSSASPVNHAPVGTSNSVTTLEDTAYPFTVANFGFTDPGDTPPNALLNVEITTLPATGSITLSGAAVSAGQFVTALDIGAGKLLYTPAANAYGAANATFTFQVQDNGGTSAGGIDLDPTPRTITVNVTPVNDAPTLTATALNPTFTEAPGLGTQAAAVSVFSGAAASTIESGQSLTGLTFTVGGLLDGASEVVVVDGKSITLGANSAGTTTTNSLAYASTISGGSATIVLSGGALTPAAMQTLVNGITYEDTSTDNPSAGNRVLTLTQIKDSGGVANGGSDTTALAIASTVTVVPVNDAPHGTSATITMAQDSSYVLSRADFGFADAAGETNAFASVRVQAPSAGTLTLAGTPIGSPTEVTVAQLDGGRLVYAPAAGASGSAYANLGFQVRDDGGALNGGVDLDPTPRTLTFNVTASAPAGQLWFTTAGPVASAGGTSWGTGNIEQFGATGDTFDVNAGLTSGPISLLAGYTAPVPIRALDYVSSTLTIGTTGAQFTLKPGDLLMVLDPGAAGTVTLNTGDGNPANDVVAGRQDIVVYRPAAAGNYASGTYSMLLQGGAHVGATTYNVHALSLVETPTMIGGTLLAAGTFVIAHSDPTVHNNVYTFTATGTGVGAATQTTNCALLISGTMLGFPSGGDKIMGLQLLSQATAFNGKVLGAGTLLVSIDGGTNTYAGVTETAFDVVALTATGTGASTAGTGQLLFDGSDLGLDATTGVNTAAKNIQGLTVVSGFVAGSVGVNAAPTLSATAQNPTFTEAPGLGGLAPAVNLFTGAAASTIEAGQRLTGLTFTIGGLLDGANEVVVVDGRSIALDANSAGTTTTNSLAYASTISGGTATVVLSGGALTAAAMQTLVDGITYQDTNADNPSAGNRVVTLTQIEDSGGIANGGSDTTTLAIASTVAVKSVNDAPTLTATALNPTFTEAAGLGTQAAAVALFSGAAAGTIESGQSLTGLTSTVSGLLDGANEVVVVDGKSIALGANSAGTTTTNSLAYASTISGASATIVLSGGALTPAAMQTLVNGITYQDISADNPSAGNRVFTLTQIKDSGGSANGGSNSTALVIASTVTVVTVNDPPAIQLPVAPSVTESATLTLSAANGNALTITDADSRSGNLEVTLVATGGQLKLGRTNNLSFVVGSGNGGETRITFDATLANINAALDGLQFSPPNGYAGPAFLEVAVNDLGHTGTGGAVADRQLLTITVAPDASNVAPVITVPGNQTTLEDTPLVLSSAYGSATSVVDDAGGLPLAVTLTATGGTLTLGTSTGGEFQVNTASANDQQAARVAMAPDGTQIVVWQSQNQDGSGQGIYLQRYSADGFALGVETLVNSTTAGDQSQPALAVAGDGRFIVAWTSNGQDGGGGTGLGVYAQRFSASGQRVGGEFRVNTTTAGDQTAPTVAMDNSGRSVVVWQSDNQDGSGWGIYGQRYAADGSTLGGEFRVNTTTAGDQTAPDVAMGVGGAFVVTWQGPQAGGGGGGGNADIYAQRFDASGAAAGAEFAVATITYKAQQAPVIASDDLGNFVIAWQSQDLDYNDGRFGVYAQRFGADGTALGAQFLVNTTTPNDQMAPAVAMDAGGDFVIAWQSAGQDSPDHSSGIYAQRYDAGGARVGGEFLVNTTIAGAQTAPAVAMSDAGRVTVVWTSANQDGSGLGVFGQRYIDTRDLSFSVGDGTADATMTFTGTQAQINDVLDGMVFTPTPNFDANAKVAILVDDLGHSGSGGARQSSASFQIAVTAVNDPPTLAVPPAQTVVENAPIVFSGPLGNAITVGDPDAGNKKLLFRVSAPVGTLTLGTLNGLLFTAGTGIGNASMTFTATLAQANAALDGLQLTLPTGYTGVTAVEIYVNDQGNTGLGGPLNTSAAVPITVVPDAVNTAPVVFAPVPQRTAVDAPLVLAGVTGNAFSILDDAGTNPVQVSVNVTNGTATLSDAIGAQTTVDSQVTAGNQSQAKVAALPGGASIVTWSSDNGDGSGAAVYAQRYDSAGARVGPEFLVNTTTANDQTLPVVAANDSGAFVIAWVSKNQDGSGLGVYMQRYDAAGNRLGAETLVNTTIAGDQTSPSVAMAADGSVVVAWQAADGSGTGIYAQRFDANGQFAGGECQVNTTTAGSQSAPALACDTTGNFVVVWQGGDADGSGIVAQRYDNAGNALGGESIVNAVTAGQQAAPTIAMNSSGAWVVGWQSGDSGSAIIAARRFDASGNPVGAQFQVNTTAGLSPAAPAVAINAGGVAAFTWQAKDANGTGVYAQAFAADGTSIGREQLVNTTTQGNQDAPAVGIAADGTYRVVWTGDNQDGLQSGIATQLMMLGNELTFASGDGVADASFTFTGPLARVNAALDAMVFTPSPGYNGMAGVQVSVNDLGSTGSGGAMLGSASAGIMVGNGILIDLDANDSSGAPGTGFRINFRPGLGPVPAADADATVTDPGTGSLQSLTLAIANPLDGAAESLGATVNGTAILASYSSATGTLTLSGTDTVANYQKVLRTVTYNDTAAAPSTAPRTINVTASDAKNPSNTAVTTVSFNGAAGAPVAANDSFATLQDQTLTAAPGALLANDSDPAFNPLSTKLVTGPAHGALALGVDGSFSYAPTPGFNGVDSFTYVAGNGVLDSNVATVTLNVVHVNHPPVQAQPIANAAATPGVVFAFTLPAGTFTDPDVGDTLTYGATLNSGAALPAWLSFDAATQTFSGTPAGADLGAVNLRVTATDTSGAKASGTFVLTVANVNHAPALTQPIAAQSATQGAAFAFALPAGTFTDPDVGDTLAYSATLNSGASLPAWLSFDAATQTFSGTPANADVGAVSLRVTATDTSGAKAFGDFGLTVSNVNDPPLLAKPIAAQAATQGAAFAFTLPTGSFTDPDVGDKLTYTATLSSGVALPAWLSFDAATQTFSGTPANADVGAVSLRVTAADTSGAKAFGDFGLTVANVNDPPLLAQAIAAQSATQGAAFVFTLPAGTFTDPDAGDKLTYTASLSSGAALPAWLSFDTATQTFAGTPANADVGAVSLRVVATDTSGAKAFGDFGLTVANVNDPPRLAKPIADASATQDAAFSLTLPAGTFADPDAGDKLTYTASLSSGAALPAWLSFDAATQTFAGTPGNADVGAAALRVTATDTAGATASATFALTVASVNHPPALGQPIGAQSATRGAAFSFTLPGSTFVDPDLGDTLTYGAMLNSGAALPAWLSFDAATQTFSGTPGNADVGAASLRVTAADTSGATASATFVLTVADVNHAPALAQPIAAPSATQGAAFAFTLPGATFTDPDVGDTLTYSAAQTSGAALPAWLSFDAVTQTFAGTPANADVGAVSLRVTATDTSGAKAFGDFGLTVTNINDPPLLAKPIADATATQDAAFKLTLPAGTFSDPDAGDTLTYSASLSSGAALPAWLSFDAVTQTFSGTPANADVGAVSLRVTATDASGAKASGTFALTVANVNDPPVAVAQVADRTVVAGQALQIQLPAPSFTDPDVGDTLHVTATLLDGTALPSWLAFNSQTLTFTVAPTATDAGSYALRVTATDGSGARAQLQFGLVVSAPALPTGYHVSVAGPTLTPVAAPAPAVAQAPAPASEATAPASPAPSAPAAATTDAAAVAATLDSDAPTTGRGGAAIGRGNAVLRALTTTDTAAAGRYAVAAVADATPTRPASRSDAVLAAAVAVEFRALGEARLLQVLHSDDVLHRLDEIQRHLLEQIESRRVTIATSIAATGGLSIGYVVWLVRGGVLMSSMLSALPAWQMIDPLPVLAAAGSLRGRRAAAKGDDADFERLFDEHAAPPAPPPAVAPRADTPAAADAKESLQ